MVSFFTRIRKPFWHATKQIVHAHRGMCVAQVHIKCLDPRSDSDILRGVSAPRARNLRILNEYDTEQMIGVYMDALAEAMSTGADQKTAEEVRTYFTQSAILLLADVILGAREMAAPRGKAPPAPRHPTLHELFEPQAGAMVNLANVTAILIASSPRGRDRVGVSVGGRATWAIGFRDMRDVLITQLKQRFPEETGEGQTSTGWRAAVDELILIARENGWVVGGEWVPSAAAEQALPAP